MSLETRIAALAAVIGADVKSLLSLVAGKNTSVAIQDEGVPLVSNPNTINFTGDGVTASQVGGVVTVYVPGGGGGGGSTTLIEKSFTQTSHGFSKGSIVECVGGTWMQGANTEGFMVSEVVNANDFKIAVAGVVGGLASITVGALYYVDPTNTNHFVSPDDPLRPYPASSILDAIANNALPLFIGLSATELGVLGHQAYGNPLANYTVTGDTVTPNTYYYVGRDGAFTPASSSSRETIATHLCIHGNLMERLGDHRNIANEGPVHYLSGALTLSSPHAITGTNGQLVYIGATPGSISVAPSGVRQVVGVVEANAVKRIVPYVEDDDGKVVAYLENCASYDIAVGKIVHETDPDVWLMETLPERTRKGIVSRVFDADHFEVILKGPITGLSGLVAGRYYYSPYTYGNASPTLLENLPSDPLAYVISGQTRPVLLADSATSGIVLENVAGVIPKCPVVVANEVYPSPSYWYYGEFGWTPAVASSMTSLATHAGTARYLASDGDRVYRLEAMYLDRTEAIPFYPSYEDPYISVEDEGTGSPLPYPAGTKHYLSATAAGFGTYTPPTTGIRQVVGVSTEVYTRVCLPYIEDTTTTLVIKGRKVGHGYTVGTMLIADTSDSGLTSLTWGKATSQETAFGMVSRVLSADEFEVAQSGIVYGVPGAVQGTTYFVSPDTPGALVARNSYPTGYSKIEAVFWNIRPVCVGVGNGQVMLYPPPDSSVNVADTRGIDGTYRMPELWHIQEGVGGIVKAKADSAHTLATHIAVACTSDGSVAMAPLTTAFVDTSSYLNSPLDISDIEIHPVTVAAAPYTKLYLSDATAGAFTTTPPSGIRQVVGYVSDSGEAVFVRPYVEEVSVGGTQQVFVQSSAPAVAPGVPYIWWQTGLGDGNDITLWIEDGQ